MNEKINRSGAKKRYEKPVLTAYGDVRTLTLNASAEVFEQQFESRSSREEDSRGGRRGEE